MAPASFLVYRQSKELYSQNMTYHTMFMVIAAVVCWVFFLQYYYSIKDISIGGRCVCNGHAEACNAKDPNDPYK